MDWIVSIGIRILGKVWAFARGWPHLRIGFCDENGVFTKDRPVVECYEPGTNIVAFLMGFFFRLSNDGPRACTFEQLYVTVKAARR